MRARAEWQLLLTGWLLLAAPVAQTPDRAVLDQWWRAAVHGTKDERRQGLQQLRTAGTTAIARGIELLREPGELSGQGVALALARLDAVAWWALRREAARADSSARALALEGLGRMRGRFADGDPPLDLDRDDMKRELTETLIACLADGDDDVLRQVFFLISSADPEQRTAIENALGEPAPLGPRAAVLLLSGRPRPPLSALRAATHDAARKIRGAAFHALLERGDAQALDGLCAAALDGPWQVRAEAAAALSSLLDAHAPKAVVDSLARFVAADHGAENADNWFDRLHPIARVVEAAAAIPEVAAPVLLAAAALPASTPWLEWKIDEIRATGIAALATLGKDAPADAVAIAIALAHEDPLGLPLQAVLLPAVVQLAPPLDAAQRREWWLLFETAHARAVAAERSPSWRRVRAAAIAGALDAIGRLGEPASLPFLFEQLAADDVARGAAAGALVDAAWDDVEAKKAVLAYLGATDGHELAHDEVLAGALSRRGAAAAPAATPILEAIGRWPRDTAAPFVAVLEEIGAGASPAARSALSAAMIARLPEVDAPAQAMANVCARLDPDETLRHRTGPKGQVLYGALLHWSPATLVPLLDDDDHGTRHHAQSMLRHYLRPDAAAAAAFATLLAQPRLHDSDLVLRTLAQVGPTPALLPAIESWTGRSRVAFAALVAAGPPAIDRLRTLLQDDANEGRIRALRSLGPAGAPLVPLLAELPEPAIGYARLTLPYLGERGIHALEQMQLSEHEFLMTVSAVLFDSLAHGEARIAVADMLLASAAPVPGIGDVDLRRYGQNPRLRTRLMLLQANLEPFGPGATETLLDTLAAPEATLRAFALRCLAGHPDRPRVAAFAGWLCDDADAEVRRAALRIVPDGR